MMIMVAISALPFVNETIANLLELLALAIGIAGGLFHILSIMPLSLALEEIEWRKRHPEEYGEGEWEAIPFLHNVLVRIRERD